MEADGAGAPKLLDEGGQGIQTVAELSKSGNPCHYFDLVRDYGPGGPLPSSGSGRSS